MTKPEPITYGPSFMHYRCLGYEIHSEQAAKPSSQASQYVLSLIAAQGQMDACLDYGCGRLRYAMALYRQSKALTVVDSAAQLDRSILIGRSTTSVRKYVAAHWPRALAVDLGCFTPQKPLYDFALCANVLSAIPIYSDRINALRNVSKALKPNGRCLVITQYTNSYFCSKKRDPTVVKFKDGFILGSETNASFYGLIPLQDLLRFVIKAGLVVESSWRHDQSAYVMCMPRREGKKRCKKR